MHERSKRNRCITTL